MHDLTQHVPGDVVRLPLDEEPEHHDDHVVDLRVWASLLLSSNMRHEFQHFDDTFGPK